MLEICKYIRCLHGCILDWLFRRFIFYNPAKIGKLLKFTLQIIRASTPKRN